MRLVLSMVTIPGAKSACPAGNRVIPKWIGKGEKDKTRRVLDAGSGNGMLSYKAYLAGNTVIGVSVKAEEVKKAKQFFN